MLYNLTGETLILEDRDGEEIIIEPAIEETFTCETWNQVIDLVEFDDHYILIHDHWWGLLVPNLWEIAEDLKIKQGDILVIPNWLKDYPRLEEFRDEFDVLICVVNEANELVTIR